VTADRLDEKALEARIEEKVRHHGADSETGRLLRDLRDALVSRASTGTDPGAREASPEDGCGGPQESCIPCRNPKRHETYRCPECTVVWCDECSGGSASPARAESDPGGFRRGVEAAKAALEKAATEQRDPAHARALRAGASLCRSLSPGPDPREAAVRRLLEVWDGWHVRDLAAPHELAGAVAALRALSSQGDAT
jgi:hypothetical protein